MLPEEPEMLQLDAFCEHTMQQNATAAGAPSRTPLVELTALLQTLWLVLRGPLRDREGAGREGRLTPRRSWNRVADWLRPALTTSVMYILLFYFICASLY